MAAAMAVVFVLQPSRAVAGWWNRAPADFEECAELAGKAATQQERTSALADCNAKFAGRRKPGGGYTYYDFLQDRSFDIAGPNPTPEEQRYIDQQYALYLERQRRSNIVAAFAAKQQEQEQEPQPVSLRTPTERVPLPQARPSKLIANQAANNSRTRDCVKPSLSCEWPRLSETINDLKKRLFGATTPTKGKKS